MNDNKTTFEEMQRWINRAIKIRVQTELGTAVGITKVEARKLLEILERRDVMPGFDCTEVRPGRYLVTIQAGSPGIYCDN